MKKKCRDEGTQANSKYATQRTLNETHTLKDRISRSKRVILRCNLVFSGENVDFQPFASQKYKEYSKKNLNNEYENRPVVFITKFLTFISILGPNSLMNLLTN